MKKIKKLLAMIMAMTMVLGMAMTVSAAETTDVDITVENGEKADLYYAQIVEPDPTSTSGWKFVDAYAEYFTNAEIDIDTLIDIAADDEVNGNAESGKLTTSTELAGVLESLREDVIAAGATADSFQDSFNVKSGGLYVIVPSETGYTYSPTLVYVPVNSTEDITVVSKGSADQIAKEVKDPGQSVAPGDIIEYEVTVEYPYISANYQNPSFTVTDKLTNGTFVIDAEHPVTLTDIDDAYYSISEANGTDTLIIDFSTYDITKAGTKVTITYWVKVDEDVQDDSNPLRNEVTSSLDIEGDGNPTETKHVVVVNPVTATFSKVDADDISKHLPGAVFEVYKGTAEDDVPDELVSIVADAATIGDVTLPDGYEDREALLVVDGIADGSITIKGLDGQEKYYIKEIVAPAGYSIDGIPHTLQGGGLAPNGEHLNVPVYDDTGKVLYYQDTYDFNDFTVVGNQITNTQLSSLPSTGGIGTTIFTIGGCAIMIAAAALYFVNRRKSEEN